MTTERIPFSLYPVCPTCEVTVAQPFPGQLLCISCGERYAALEPEAEDHTGRLLVRHILPCSCEGCEGAGLYRSVLDPGAPICRACLEIEEDHLSAAEGGQ